MAVEFKSRQRVMQMFGARTNQRKINRDRKRLANDIAEALYLPGRTERLQRWSPEFLARLGDFPDLDEANRLAAKTGSSALVAAR